MGRRCPSDVAGALFIGRGEGAGAFSFFCPRAALTGATAYVDHHAMRGACCVPVRSVVSVRHCPDAETIGEVHVTTAQAPYRAVRVTERRDLRCRECRREKHFRLRLERFLLVEHPWIMDTSIAVFLFLFYTRCALPYASLSLAVSNYISIHRTGEHAGETVEYHGSLVAVPLAVA